MKGYNVIRGIKSPCTKYSGPRLIRPPMWNGKSGFIIGIILRGIVDTIIHSLFSEIVAL